VTVVATGYDGSNSVTGRTGSTGDAATIDRPSQIDILSISVAFGRGIAF
jgi:hypothetical protein